MSDKSKILDSIKKVINSASSSYIKFPSGISMNIVNTDCVNLHFTSNVLTTNMQSDSASFEAWALIIKRWLPLFNKIIISWDPISDVSNRHYQRFLFRVVNFKKLFDWFDIENSCSKYIIELDYGKTESKYFINIPGKRITPTMIENISVSSRESILESFIYYHPEDLIQICNLLFLDRQLPVGVFKDRVRNGTQVFTSGKSAIDLWGITKDNKLSIFELKNIRNKKAGIISEILFYSFVIRDLQINLINIPDETTDKLMLDAIKTKGILSYILVPEIHPLIDDELLSILNKALLSNDIVIRYIKISDSGNGGLNYLLR